MELLVHMNTEHNVTFIFSTHDKLVMDFSRRLIKLHDGRIGCAAGIMDNFRNPVLIITVVIPAKAGIQIHTNNVQTALCLHPGQRQKWNAVPGCDF
jgi:ABC-type lipoprotein export system ATPase subunit